MKPTYLPLVAVCLLALFGGRGAAQPPKPMTLPNGLRVLVRERPTRPLVTLELWAQAGAREERDDEAGCAHFLEHALFKGTKNRATGELDEALERLGGTWSAATGPDYARYGTTVATPVAETALGLLAEVVRGATLPDAEVERERRVVLQELARAADPAQRCLEALYAVAFPDHPYRRSPGGSPAAIRARGRDTLAAFYRRVYQPERCLLVLTGDVTAERARAWASRAFGDWKPAPPERAAEPPPAPISPAAKPRSVEISSESDRAGVGIGFLAPPASERQNAALAQIAAVLLESDRRLAALRRAGIEVAVRYTPRRDASLFLLLAQLPANATPLDQRLTEAETLLRQAAESLHRAPPSAAELDAAKGRLLGRALLETETNAGFAFAVGYAETVGGESPEALRVRLGRIAALDVAQFARSAFQPDRASVAVLRPRAPRNAAIPSALAEFGRSPAPPPSHFLLPTAACLLPASAPPPDAPRRVTLPNGVRLILQPEPKTELTAVVAFVRTGEVASATENAIAELTARALFGGSQNRSSEAVEEAIGRVGGGLETLRTPRYVAVTCLTVAGRLREVARLFGEALQRADFAPEALERARTAWNEERRRREESPLEALQARLAAAFRPELAFDAAQLRRVTTEQAQRYFRAQYVPTQTVIVVVGRFHPESVQQAFEDNLSDFDRPARPLAPPAPRVPLDAAKPEVVALPGSAAYALLGTRAPDVTSADYPAFTVLQHLLGVGHASRLYRQTREALGLGYEVGARWSADRAAPLTLYLQWAATGEGTPAPDAVLQRLHDQFDSVLRASPDDRELTRARNLAIGRDALRHERARDRAFLLGWYEAMGLGYDYDATLPQRLAAVSAEDIRRVANLYLSHRRALVGAPQPAP